MPDKNTTPAAGTVGAGDRAIAGGDLSYFTTPQANGQAAVLEELEADLHAAQVQRNGSGPEDTPWLAKAWNLRTLAQAYEPRPPIEYAIAGLFAKPSLNIVYSAPGQLKSMLLADAAVCVAADRPWLPPLPSTDGAPFAVRQFPVLWIDLDNGRRRTDDRFAALGRARNLPADIPLHYVSMPTPWPNLSTPTTANDLAGLISHLHAGLIVIDNLGLITGDTNENDAGMANVMGSLRSLAEDSGAAIVVIHHQRKGQNGTTAGRKGDSLRGHSSIEAALDLALRIEREDGASTVTVESTKVRGVDVPRFGAIFTYDHVAGTTELERAMFYRVATDEAGSDRDIDDAIFEALQDSPKNQKALVDAVRTALDTAERKPGRDRIRARADLLASQDRIERSKGDRNATLYGLRK